jgi:hypothetical protein
MLRPSSIKKPNSHKAEEPMPRQVGWLTVVAFCSACSS